MAIFLEQHSSSKTRPAAGAAGRTAHGVCLLLLFMLLCLSGCGGCRKTPDAEEAEKQQAEEKAKKKEKEKAPFESKPVAVMPSGRAAGLCKPGHWIGLVWPEVKANRGDFQGELQTEIVDPADQQKASLVRGALRDDQRAARRPGQGTAEIVGIVHLDSAAAESPFGELQPGSRRRRAGGDRDGACHRLRCRPISTIFIVLSQKAGRYDYLDKRLDSIHLHPSPINADPEPKYYEVVSMPATRRPSLPTNALYWTSIAYLLWDDFDPALWDVDQQRALIDWLHWGGQIIVSGPDALEQLRNSFLRPYLPASVEKVANFFGRRPGRTELLGGRIRLSPQPRETLAGRGTEKTDPQAKFLPDTGDLLVERQVGRGRIVASAFRLTGPELTGWTGLRLLFNACLLRRPAREFSAGQDSEELRFRWADGKANSPRLDAAKMTAVRYFARDTGVEFADYAADIMAAEAAANGIRSAVTTIPQECNGSDDAGNLATPSMTTTLPFRPTRKLLPGWRPGTTSAPWPMPREGAA